MVYNLNLNILKDILVGIHFEFGNILDLLSTYSHLSKILLY